MQAHRSKSWLNVCVHVCMSLTVSPLYLPEVAVNGKLIKAWQGEAGLIRPMA